MHESGMGDAPVRPPRQVHVALYAPLYTPVVAPPDVPSYEKHPCTAQSVAHTPVHVYGTELHGAAWNVPPVEQEHVGA